VHPWAAGYRRDDRRPAGGRQDAEDVLAAYPYLEREDITAALAYAAWRTEERELPLSHE
jgi:uncharacterized protein (DUF433 family)